MTNLPNLAELPRYQAARFEQPATGPAVVREMFAIMAEEQMPINRVAAKAGIFYDTVRRWRRCSGSKSRRSASLELVDACLRVLGYKLAIVPVDHPGVRVKWS